MEVARGFVGVQVLSFAHSGKATVLNRAATSARGEVLFFLDGDLILAPDYVERMVAPILAGECIGTCHAVEWVANPENRWARCWQRMAGLPPDRRLVVKPEDLAAGSIVFRAIRTEDFRRVGGFEQLGYLDDQTLAPKLGTRARWVEAAQCRHFNAERLSEVLAMGRWQGKSVVMKHGARGLLHYLPPLPLFRAARRARTQGSMDLWIYLTVLDLGIFLGGWAFVWGRRRNHGI